jgi:hypothetical protein
MKIRKRGGMLYIVVPLLDQPRMSKGGKVLLVASSNGPKRTALKVDKKNVIVMVVAYIKPDITKGKNVYKEQRSSKHRRLNPSAQRPRRSPSRRRRIR